MAIEIVDLPINSMVIFHSYVNVYQRVMIDRSIDRSIVGSFNGSLKESVYGLRMFKGSLNGNEWQFH